MRSIVRFPKMTTRLAGSVAAGIAFAALGASCVAQQDSTAQSPPSLVIKATVRRVILDVVVTDSDGKPVQGLERDDFAVSEDRDPQRVLSFESHELGAEPAAPPKLPALPANTYLSLPSEPERGPLYIMLLDLVNTEPEDQMTVRSRVSDFIKAKPAGTRFAIFVLSDELRLVQGFTSDTNLLNAAIDTHHPRPHVPMVFLYGANNGKGDEGFTLQIFEHIAGFVDGLPGRKNIFWVSGGFPLRLFPTQDDGPPYKERIERMLDAMARNQVSIYPVDSRGVVVTESYAPSGSASGGGAVGTASSSGPGRVFSGSAGGGASSRPATASTGVGASELAAGYMSEDGIAQLTGGHAYYSNNNVAEELAKATDRGGSYYELSYSPTNKDYDGKLRSIEVKLAKKGYRLDYRRNYYATEEGQSPIQYESVRAESAQAGQPGNGAKPGPVRAVGDSLDVEMQYGAPMDHNLLFKAHLHALGAPAMGTPQQMANLADQPAYFKVRRKNRPAKTLSPVMLQTFAVEYTLPAGSQGMTSDVAGPPSATLEVAAAAFDADGRMLNGVVDDAFEPSGSTPSQSGGAPSAAAPSSQAAQAAKGFYRIDQQIDVPVTAVSMRIAVRDKTTNRLGTIEVPLPLAPEANEAAVAPHQASRLH